MHGSHDLGMAMDLETNDYIDYSNQRANSLKNTPAISIPAGTNGWNNQKAIDLAELLPAQTSRGKNVNNQRDATLDFLSIYWATKNNLGAIKDNRGNYYTGNHYPEVQKVLKALGIKSKDTPRHHHHFHLYFTAPDLKPIDGGYANLVASGYSESLSQSLEPITTDYELTPKEVSIDDYNFDKVMEHCHLMNVIVPSQTEFNLYPVTVFNQYVNSPDYSAIKQITLLKNPEHGTLDETHIAEINRGEIVSIEYHPEEGFFGLDQVSFLIETVSGEKVLLKYQINIGDMAEDMAGERECPQPAEDFEDLYKDYGT